MSMRVPVAALADYPSVVHVARETLAHHDALAPDIFRDADPALPQVYFEELVRDNDVDVIVAEDDGGEIVGDAITRLRRAELPLHVPRTVAYIDNFGVLVPYRRGVLAA